MDPNLSEWFDTSNFNFLGPTKALKQKPLFSTDEPHQQFRYTEEVNNVLQSYIQNNLSTSNSLWFNSNNLAETNANNSSDMLLNIIPQPIGLHSRNQIIPEYLSSADEVTSTTSNTYLYELNSSSAQSSPLTLAKHICAICGDRASGKHYGVYSCEGCKGFFKRTVRKDLTYSCRENRSCIIDKRQRNRCQFCRYRKCQTMGMKREAVQEERQGSRVEMRKTLSTSSYPSQVEAESTSNYSGEMPPEGLLGAEEAADALLNTLKAQVASNEVNACEIAQWQILRIVDWALMIPSFSEIHIEDQAKLIHTGWSELILTDTAFRSTKTELILWPEQQMERHEAEKRGCHVLFDRIINELTAKMRELAMDKVELGALRSIILFNPSVCGLRYSALIETQREKIYQCLEEYCRQQNPQQGQRFAKLLLRLPAIRSLSLRCVESNKIVGTPPNSQELVRILISRQNLAPFDNKM